MYKHAKRDANHPQVVDTFRKCGASVWDTADLGDGGTDCVISYNGVNVLVEIKDGSKPPSQTKLTEEEGKFHKGWKGPIAIVYSELDAVKLIYKIRNGELN